MDCLLSIHDCWCVICRTDQQSSNVSTLTTTTVIFLTTSSVSVGYFQHYILALRNLDLVPYYCSLGYNNNCVCVCTGADKPVALELPNQWLWDIIDEFIYQVRCRCVEFCWYTTMIWKQINQSLVREHEFVCIYYSSSRSASTGAKLRARHWKKLNS